MVSPHDVREIGERTPRPDRRVNALAMVAGAAAAGAAYVLALSAGALPSGGFSVVLLTAAPLLAALALPLFLAPAGGGDEALRWFGTGLAAGLPAMLLQLVSFPLVAGGGGVLSTSGDGSAALYLTFHLSLAVGALAGALRVGPHWRWPVVAGFTLLAVALGLDAVPLPVLLEADGSFTALLTGTELVLAVLLGGCAVAWLVREGPAGRLLHTAAAVALSLSTYDLVLNAISARRFDPVWWSSLSMRLATYAVLAVVGVTTVLTRLSGTERYTEAELGRREDQLRSSLRRTEELLTSVTRTANALQRTLLPSELVAVPGTTFAARHRTASGDVWTSWYDTVLLPSGGVALVVGAVDADDLSAAPVVGLVRGALRSYGLEGHPPSVVLERANALLASSGARHRVDVAYAELYPEDRVLTVSVAGRPTVEVADPRRATFEVLPTRPGPALGAPAGARWEERTVLLAAGALLVLAAPGIAGTSAGVLPDEPEGLADAIAAAVPAAQALALLVADTAAKARPAVERTLPVHPISAAVARTWIADLLGVWREAGVLTAGDDGTEVAQLLLTELVSNAVRHSDLSIGVRVELQGSDLRVEVSDNSHRMPVLGRVGADATSGRGLFLVDTLSRAWGVDTLDQGKTVWFEVDLALPDELGELDEDALLAAFADDADV